MKQSGATKKQIQLIHVAKTKLGITDDEYREFLKTYGVRSSKQLTKELAAEALEQLQKYGFKITKPLKYSNLSTNRYDKNGDLLASPGQLRKIEAVWFSSKKVRNKTHEALQMLIKRIIGVDSILWIQASNVNKVIKAINSL